VRLEVDGDVGSGVVTSVWCRRLREMIGETFFAVSLDETRFARQACGARDIPPA